MKLLELHILLLKQKKIHEEWYKQAKEATKEEKDIEKGKIYICDVCGYTVEGEAPDRCPICGGAQKANFQNFKKRGGFSMLGEVIKIQDFKMKTCSYNRLYRKSESK